jgi:hypothetical protein
MTTTGKAMAVVYAVEAAENTWLNADPGIIFVSFQVAKLQYQFVISLLLQDPSRGGKISTWENMKS